MSPTNQTGAPLPGSLFQVRNLTGWTRPSPLGGGPFNGFSPQQTLNNFKDGDQTQIRKVLRNSWNKSFAQPTYMGHGRITTPFRAVNNSGDYLGRINYSCGGSNQINPSHYISKGIIGSLPQNCDGTGIPAANCNVRFVADSSDYITFKKQRAIVRNYNDLSNGGDQHNASYVPLMAVRRF